MKTKVSYVYLVLLVMAAFGRADVIPTDQWIVVYGSVALNGSPAVVGTVIDAYDPDGVHCGQFILTSEGDYGLMPVYRDDLSTPAVDEGCDPEDEVSFYVNGVPATAVPTVIWTSNGETSLADLSAGDNPYICGDADGSGAVDIDDVVYLIQYIFAGGPEPNPQQSGDADATGGTDIDDVVYLIAYIFASGYEPLCTGTVTDFDGNVYRTIRIGDQWWMAENLKVIHYRNGDPIPNVTDDLTWEWVLSGAYCNYDNDEGHVATYGRLYNWWAVDDPRNIAPEGWHVPSDIEWKQLEMYIGMSQAEADATGYRGTYEGDKLKEAGISHWCIDNTGATNETGFTALPGGERTGSGHFIVIGEYGYWWSSTGDINSSWSRALSCSAPDINRTSYNGGEGQSVRCVRD